MKFFSLTSLTFALPVVAFAQSSYTNPLTIIVSGKPVTTFHTFLAAIVDSFVAFMVPIIVIFIIYAGFLFVTARGDSGQIEKARFVILWCLIGALVLLGAKVISAAVQSTILAL